jgi:hypothetical protein
MHGKGKSWLARSLRRARCRRSQCQMLRCRKLRVFTAFTSVVKKVCLNGSSNDRDTRPACKNRISTNFTVNDIWILRPRFLLSANRVSKSFAARLIECEGADDTDCLSVMRDDSSKLQSKSPTVSVVPWCTNAPRCKLRPFRFAS